MNEVLIDPEVSLIKFNHEVKSILTHSSDLRKRGWIIESTIFPTVRVTFLATRVSPPIAALTVDIDFTNYNICAPSVRFLHPITNTPIYLEGKRKLPGNEENNLMVLAHPETKEPFLCLPGIYEYHIHPEHDGDSWDIHRYTGEGSLYFLLEHIWQYCVKSIVAYAGIVPLKSNKMLQVQLKTNKIVQIQFSSSNLSITQEAIE